MSWLLLPFGYLLGSIPFGVLLTSLVAGKDVRAEGSGNIGATNVARVAGKKLGVLVLILDAGKGSLPMVLGLWLAPGQELLHVAVGSAAFLGHVFPVWLRFKGGKGVATALGVLLVLQPISALIGLGTWLAVLAVTRISSVGSLLGALFATIVGFFLPGPLAYPLLGVGFLGAMLWTHRSNVGRLLKRAENRV